MMDKNRTETVEVDPKTLAFLNALLAKPGRDIYEKYGLKRDEAFVYTANFGGGYEADIKIVICEEDPPFIDAVLFYNGCETVVLSPDADALDGEYVFSGRNGSSFTVCVAEGKK